MPTPFFILPNGDAVEALDIGHDYTPTHNVTAFNVLELLKACRELVDWYESMAPDVKGGPHKAYELARAVIRKAEGRS